MVYRMVYVSAATAPLDADALLALLPASSIGSLAFLPPRLACCRSPRRRFRWRTARSRRCAASSIPRMPAGSHRCQAARPICRCSARRASS